MLKKTKIVATIGPSSESGKILLQLIKSGMNVARLNFSHGDHRSHALLIKNIRSAASKAKQEIAIIQDLQGPRIRVAKITDQGLDLQNREKIILVSSNVLQAVNLLSLPHRVIPVDYDHFAESLGLRSSILISDGLIQLAVEKIEDHLVYAKVIKGGLVLSHKGINVPGLKLKTAVITEKDKKDLAFGLKQGVDFVALSFVGSAQDILDLKKLINKLKPKQKPQVIAKIERMEAFKNKKEIIKAADAIMVARGDLGIEVPQAKVPLMQKELIFDCLAESKPVIVATQMLDSMIQNPKPTRAEVSDVANAVIDGTDAVMLSGETAFGKYPVETVKVMQDIIVATEKSPYQKNISSHADKQDSDIQAVADSVFHLARNAHAKLIVAFTRSGFTAKVIARYRSEKAIVAMVVEENIARQLNLVWGVESCLIKDCSNLTELIEVSEKILLKNKKVKIGDKIVFVSGQLLGQTHNINVIQLHTINK
ncbi:pyruvate kinase [Candidatus Nomurabacteria bacterium]|nr:pyruvate kinase [Candidatus Nomurabacteria bacterium]